MARTSVTLPATSKIMPWTRLLTVQKMKPTELRNEVHQKWWMDN